MFTSEHQVFWDKARRTVGDRPCTGADRCAAAAPHHARPSGPRGDGRALTSGRHDPDLVAVEARRHLTAPTIGAVVALLALTPPAARADTDRAAPSLLGYDDLLGEHPQPDQPDSDPLNGKATA